MERNNWIIIEGKEQHSFRYYGGLFIWVQELSDYSNYFISHEMQFQLNE